MSKSGKGKRKLKFSKLDLTQLETRHEPVGAKITEKKASRKRHTDAALKGNPHRENDLESSTSMNTSDENWDAPSKPGPVPTSMNISDENWDAPSESGPIQNFEDISITGIAPKEFITDHQHKDIRDVPGHNSDSRRGSTHRGHNSDSRRGSTDRGHNSDSRRSSTDRGHNSDSRRGSTDRGHNSDFRRDSTDRGHNSDSRRGSTDRGHNSDSRRSSTDRGHNSDSRRGSTDRGHNSDSSRGSTDHRNKKQFKEKSNENVRANNQRKSRGGRGSPQPSQSPTSNKSGDWDPSPDVQVGHRSSFEKEATESGLWDSPGQQTASGVWKSGPWGNSSYERQKLSSSGRGIANPSTGKDRTTDRQNWRSDTNRDRYSNDNRSKENEYRQSSDRSIKRRDDNWLDTSCKESWSPERKVADPEYSAFEQEKKSKVPVKFVKVTECESDLFAMSKEYSLAHCVAEDMSMGSGIAVQFRRDFKRVDELLNQRQRQGGLALLEDENRYIYYLVTKRASSGKPTYHTLFSSLLKLRTHVQEHQISKLAIPRIGCGLDRLEWDEVKRMVEFVFKDVDIEVVVCNFQQVEDSPSRHRNCKLVNVERPIEEIEVGTIIVYLSTEDGHVSKEMENLDKKFNFLNEFRHARKNLGTVVRFSRNEKEFVLFGCIVRKKPTDPIDFVAFNNCIKSIQKENNKLGFYYVGIQAVNGGDQILNAQITNILRNVMRSVDVYMCWPGDLQKYMPFNNRESINQL